MSLKRKIATGFLISASIIAVLVIFQYIGFVKIKAEIHHLEFTDTIRSKSLQLRRHEKNYFLFGPIRGVEEAAKVHQYVNDMQTVLREHPVSIRPEELVPLEQSVGEYAQRFSHLEELAHFLLGELRREEAENSGRYRFFPLVEVAFLDKPIETAEFLSQTLGLGSDTPLISGLHAVEAETLMLRKKGEGMINIAQELDKGARVRVETLTGRSQTAILVFFPLFFLVGIGALYVIASSVIQRLESLSLIMEEAGKGDFKPVPLDDEDESSPDEVVALLRKFNEMQNQLGQRNQELKLKNEQLLEHRKLAAIGTLASGVAHELNNPLNNITISANMLDKELFMDDRPLVRETVADIVGQTIRVKGIIQDLLEFARGRAPQFQQADLVELIRKAYESVSRSSNVDDVKFMIQTPEHRIEVDLDPQRMERVFINLFMNAFHAMNGSGTLNVQLRPLTDTVEVGISDTGKGMNAEQIDKIFEPFYTTSERGTGLGLAIVFSIVDAHKGTIRISSEVGKGTTFLITLPRKKG